METKVLMVEDFLQTLRKMMFNLALCAKPTSGNVKTESSRRDSTCTFFYKVS